MAIINTIRLDKKDYLRALLTDTSPSDVPIIFSNEGLYINAHRSKEVRNGNLNLLVRDVYVRFIDPELDGNKSVQENLQKKNSFSSPYKYKIIKNEHSLRTLSLVHPRNQIKMSEFYRDYSSDLNYWCSKSNFSSRAPVKIANSFTLKTNKRKIDNTNYKKIDIDTLESELYKKTASSYFSYKGHTRIYKVYNSNRFYELEKKFSHMWLLDIANCFDSIYSHSISWAAKEKEHIKKHVSYTNQISQKLDTLMQRSNNNETNGICIGSEFSRVFSEIIFQRIDTNIENFLCDKFKLKRSKDYEIIRYVDDYIVFSNKGETSKIIYNAISDCLNEYNLYLSEEKTKKYEKPLITEKSSLILGINEILARFDDNLFSSLSAEKDKHIHPKEIFRKDRFKNTFIDKIKKLCKENNQDYTLTSSYLISVFNNRISSLVFSYGSYVYNNSANYDINKLNLIFRDSIEILLDLMLFFYRVKPALNSSNKIAQSIIEVDRFILKEMPNHLPYVRTLIMQDITFGFNVENNESYRNGFVTLERLNILLATNEFDDNYSIEQDYLLSLLSSSEGVSYFDIISILYYCKNKSIYSEVKRYLENQCQIKLKSCNLDKNSELLHLMLDLSTCPYISVDLKATVIKKLYPQIPDGFTIDTIANELLNTYWFVKWSNSDLFDLLTRKELHPVY